jgi:hypothetical protein
MKGLKVVGEDQGTIDEDEYQIAITFAGPIINVDKIKVTYFLF